MPAFKKILVPVDFDEPSERALAYAVELAKPLGAAVTVLHAFEIPQYGFPEGAGLVVVTSEMATRILEGARGGLDAMLGKHAASGVKLTAVVKQGPPDEEIVKASNDVDLVVMGTHGCKGIQRALLGSVTEKVVRASARPVLIVHGSA